MRAIVVAVYKLLFVSLILCTSFNPCIGQNIRPDHWMLDIKDYIYNYTLLDITLPGTHDSGMYYYQNNVGPEESDLLDYMIEIGTELHLPLYSFIGDWAIAQNTTFYQQLMGGVRYLDMRACIFNSEWYTEHFLIGVPSQFLLNDIKLFVANHSGEVIILQVGDLSGATAGDKTVLLDLIYNTLHPYLVIPNHKTGFQNLTIGQMIKTRQQIVVLFPAAAKFPGYNFLWDPATYTEGSYANKGELAQMQDWNYQKISTMGGHGKLFELSWTLTTQIDQIEKSVDPHYTPRTLYELAMIADGALYDFAFQYKNYKLGNVILVDFWEAAKVVPLAIYLNTRMCNDNPEYIAARAEGQYCRWYYEEGYCTNVEYMEWMSKNCRLSCGYC